MSGLPCNTALLIKLALKSAALEARNFALEQLASYGKSNGSITKSWLSGAAASALLLKSCLVLTVIEIVQRGE